MCEADSSEDLLGSRAVGALSVGRPHPHHRLPADRTSPVPISDTSLPTHYFLLCEEQVQQQPFLYRVSVPVIDFRRKPGKIEGIPEGHEVVDGVGNKTCDDLNFETVVVNWIPPHRSRTNIASSSSSVASRPMLRGESACC